MAKNGVTGWVGWVWFAAVMLLTVGVLDLLGGVVAIFDPGTTFVTGAGAVFTLDATGWGWLHAIFGAVLILVAIFLFSGRAWARVAAIILVVLNLIAQVVTLSVTPWWSAVVIVLDILVLWAIIVHGDEARRAAGV